MEPCSRRDFLKQTGLGAAMLAAGTAVTAAAKTARPNIVLFYFDDLDFDELGVYDPLAFPTYSGAREKGLFREDMNPWLAYLDSPAIHTPTIDGLAQDGARFDHFYVTSTICSPSRYALLTGRYASRSDGVCRDFPPGGPANVVQNAHLGPGESNIAKRLKAQGYATGMVGKWHNSDWDGPHGGRVKGVAPDADPRDPKVAAAIREVYDRGVNYIRERLGFDYVSRVYLQNKEALGIPRALQVHNLEWLVEGALEFIDAHHEAPFFLYFASTTPHGWVGSADFLKADPCATPAGMLDTPPKGMPPREDTARRARAAGVKGRLVEATWFDDAVAAVLGRIEKLGLAENTLVLFISDHQNRGKRTLYEAARVPALARWPKRIAPGQTIGSLCANIDVAPTLLDACGAPTPAGADMDGRSFLPLLTGRGDSVPWRESLLLEVAYARAVVTKDWKYIALRYPPKLREAIGQAEPKTYAWDGTAKRVTAGNRWNKKGAVYIPYGANKDFPGYFDPDQLYDLKHDPYEQKNLAEDPACAERLAEMKALLSRHLQDLSHTFGEFTRGDGHGETRMRGK